MNHPWHCYESDSLVLMFTEDTTAASQQMHIPDEGDVSKFSNWLSDFPGDAELVGDADGTRKGRSQRRLEGSKVSSRGPKGGIRRVGGPKSGELPDTRLQLLRQENDSHRHSCRKRQNAALYLTHFRSATSPCTGVMWSQMFFSSTRRTWDLFPTSLNRLPCARQVICSSEVDDPWHATQFWTLYSCQDPEIYGSLCRLTRPDASPSESVPHVRTVFAANQLETSTRLEDLWKRFAQEILLSPGTATSKLEDLRSYGHTFPTLVQRPLDERSFYSDSYIVDFSLTLDVSLAEFCTRHGGSGWKDHRKIVHPNEVSHLHRSALSLRRPMARLPHFSAPSRKRSVSIEAFEEEMTQLHQRICWAVDVSPESSTVLLFVSAAIQRVRDSTRAHLSQWICWDPPALSAVSYPITVTVSFARTSRKWENVDTTSRHDGQWTLEIERGWPTTPQEQSRVAAVPFTVDVPQEASVMSAKISASVSNVPGALQTDSEPSQLNGNESRRGGRRTLMSSRRPRNLFGPSFRNSIADRQRPAAQ